MINYKKPLIFHIQKLKKSEINNHVGLLRTNQMKLNKIRLPWTKEVMT